jgi:hypothetical protein
MVKVHVSFGLHTFTRAIKADDLPEDNYSDNREKRCFDYEPYEHSHRLPTIVREIPTSRKLYFSRTRKMLSHYLNRALEHATLAGEQYNDGEVSEHVFTNRYGRPLTYDGLRAAMRIAGNEIPLRQIRALAESHKPGTLGHLGQMRKIYTRTVRTSPVK